MDAIRISNLVKKYGTVLAVEDLSLTVPKGSMFGFLGPNGSGKSTTIGCLTGLLDPTAGDIEILGERFTADSTALKRRMGVMPESLGLFDPLYAHEFLAFVARMFGLDETVTRKRVAELLGALELTDTSKTLAEYSTGMRKRVAFAAAVIHTPDVLFLDEPFESIDPAGVSLMKQWLRRLTEQGRTVFVTSHVLETVERLCDRVAIVTRPGKLVWQGDITVLGRDGTIEHDGKSFHALEPLFLHLTGEHYADLNWL
ncbi:MAG TPA: ABC transporter ATP-binding protein [Tepidisphaeraceae bacterium]|jgi:ABC-2 type transport system ATP-binding protein|nr:ABC transporter ATP-binding protein [Tepidisphaeraceae bacterium]